MKLFGLPTGVTDWSTLKASSQSGARGMAEIRGRQIGDMQLRMVAYGAGYIADHWCHKGHVVLVISGDVTIAHEGGRSYELTAGMAYHVSDNEGSPHRVTSREGASVFILD